MGPWTAVGTKLSQRGPLCWPLGVPPGSGTRIFWWKREVRDSVYKTSKCRCVRVRGDSGAGCLTEQSWLWKEAGAAGPAGCGGHGAISRDERTAISGQPPEGSGTEGGRKRGQPARHVRDERSPSSCSAGRCGEVREGHPTRLSSTQCPQPPWHPGDEGIWGHHTHRPPPPSFEGWRPHSPLSPE